MMKFKRSLALTAAVFAVTTMTAMAAEKTKIEFWSNSLSPKFDTVMKDLTGKFNASQGDIEAKWVDVDWDAFLPRLTASLAGGTAPDLVNLPKPWMDELAQKKLLLPITKQVAGFKGNYTQGALKDVTYEGDKQIYGMPWYQVTGVLFYNKELLTKAGVKEAPKSFTELLSVAKQVKEKTGVTGFAPKLNDGFAGWFLYDGLPVVKNGKAVFNSPEHVKLVEAFADAYKSGAIPKDAYKMGFEEQIAAFDGGKVAIFAEGAHALKRTQTDAPKIYAQTGVAPFPLARGKTPFGGYLFVWSVPKTSKHADAAVKLGQFLTSDDAQLAFAKASATFPSTNKALADAFFQAGAKSNDPVAKALSTAADSIKVTQTLTVSGLPDEAAMNKKLDEAVEAAITGRTPAKQALDEAAAYWNEKFSAKK
ncbi:putative chitobiose transport system substrate-binding protein [Andreprevotia lacus DSM 23236]|jgi:putative chitobiose transport system substrate-binding protein|uniref:Putative chitobiose transport system substrate-binding protein n=1 Tax=Andreprevotia lacus DSM 23236 TaxID=1121001 RepID=A0A1W1X7I2_9NEIS|nr:sugar ABC transporter substrate-binding protein [Andreprevotia lacus]SMC19800.1 putative chitobiose transport system substrate-binding protein [Andreprevotia lacus DSM 23236]